MYYPKSPFLKYPLVESQLIKWNPTAHQELLPWLCIAPSITTYRVNILRTSLAAFRQRLECLLATKYIDPPHVYELPTIPEVVCVARTRQPATRPGSKDSDNCRRVIVDSCCGAALLRGAHLYAPGVLAMEAGTQLHEQVHVYADLAGQCKRGTSTRYFSPELLFVGVGEVRMQRYQLYANNTAGNSNAAVVTGIAVEMQESVSGVPPLGNRSDGSALLQNLPSIVCVRVLDPQPGERVLDMCASPGNKTSHIAELMRDEGIIVALDKTARKIADIEQRLAMHGLECVRTFICDATKACADEALRPGQSLESTACPPYPPHSFDRVLLDAPCSALGNRPLLSSSITPRMLESFPRVQRKLFEAAVRLLRPGGVLVYSTCTVTVDENERIVAWALRKFTELQLVAANPQLGGPGLPDVELSEAQRQLVQRFGPPPTNANKEIDTVGFFIAKFLKVSMPLSNE